MVTIQLHNDMQCYARSDFTGTLTCKDIMFKGINDGGEGLFYNKLIIQQLLYDDCRMYALRIRRGFHRTPVECCRLFVHDNGKGDAAG